MSPSRSEQPQMAGPARDRCGRSDGDTAASDWFFVRKVLDDVWVIIEPGHVNMWLIIGTEFAVLVDSGLGVRPLRPVVAALTSRPVVVVNTHAHFDHIGGNSEFDIVLAAAETAALLESPLPDWVYPAYGEVAAAAAERHDPQPSDPLGLYTPEFRMKPWPAGIKLVYRPQAPSRTLRIGEQIDLGGLELSVVATPGHSADSISLIDEHCGRAFVGDLVNRGVHYAHLPDATLDDYADSVEILRELGPRALFSNHWPRPIGDLHVLNELGYVIDTVSAGTGPLTNAVDVVGQEVNLATSGLTSLTVADPAHPVRSIVARGPRQGDEDEVARTTTSKGVERGEEPGTT